MLRETEGLVNKHLDVGLGLLGDRVMFPVNKQPDHLQTTQT